MYKSPALFYIVEEYHRGTSVRFIYVYQRCYAHSLCFILQSSYFVSFLEINKVFLRILSQSSFRILRRRMRAFLSRQSTQELDYTIVGTTNYPGLVAGRGRLGDFSHMT